MGTGSVADVAGHNGAPLASRWEPAIKHAAKRVLIIDDEPFIARAVSKILLAEGYVVETCLDWLEISKAVYTLQPDVILLDVNMPVLKGNEVCEILRRHMIGFVVQVKIFFYSSEPVEQLQQMVAECGADGYIPKNTPGPELIERMRVATAV